jgi:hypothetical protein
MTNTRPAIDIAAAFTRLSGWMTRAQHATYSLSALRLVYGFSMLAFLASNFADRQYLWGVASDWVEPEASRVGHLAVLRSLFSKSDATLFDVSYLVLVLLAALFLVGWKTRIVTPLLLLFWVGLSTNSTVLTNGGDTIMRIVLLFLVFANLSKHWSVDAWLSSRGAGATRWRWPSRLTAPSWASNAAHNAALVACGYQIMLVYVTSGIFKLQGAEWREGTGFYYSLVLDVFRPFPALSDLAWQVTPGVFVATFLSIWVQLLFPVLVLWRPTRIVALVFLLGMHAGIGLFLGLWPFSLAMIGLDLLFVRDGTWRKALRWVRDVAGVLREILVDRRVPAAPAPAAPAPAAPVPPVPVPMPAAAARTGRNHHLHESRKKLANSTGGRNRQAR